MANAISAAPASLAAQIIPGLVGELAVVNAFSTNLTGEFTRGKVVCPIIGTNPNVLTGRMSP